MSKLSKIKMEEILKKVPMILYKEEITYCCGDVDTVYKFFELCNEDGSVDYGDLTDFLIKNEGKINKGKLLLITANNYLKYLYEIQQKIYSSTNNEEKLFYQQRYDIGAKIFINIKTLLKGSNEIVPIYRYDSNTNRFKIEALDSKQILEGKSNNTKKLKRYNEINENVKLNQISGREEDQDYEGVAWLMQAIVLTDLYEVFPDIQFGDAVRTMIIENELLSRNIATREQLNKLREGSIEEYDKFVDDNLDVTRMLSDMSTVIKDYIDYVDMDKLIMICAYRFINGVDHNDLKIENTKALKETLEEIVKILGNDRISIKCNLQDRREEYELKEINFSVQDIKECLRKFVNNTYLTTEDINNYKQQIENGEINLYDIDAEKIDVIYSAKDLENIATLNDENFEFAAKKLEWDNEIIVQKIIEKGNCSFMLLKDLMNDEKLSTENIIDLYMQKIIPIEQIEKLKIFEDFAKKISLDKLEEYYNIFNQQDDEQKGDSAFYRYLDLYKEILIKDNEKALESNSDKLMEHIVEGYKKEDREAYVQKVETYYKEGILTLDSILEWDDEKIIERFYQDGLIDIKNIDELLKNKKLSFDFVNKKYTAEVFDKELDYDERLRILNTGFVEQDDIFKLFNQNLIFEADLAELAKKSIINQNDLNQLLENRTMEELEKQSSIKLGNLNILTKRNNEIYSDNDDTEYVKDENKKAKIIIDPNERMEFIGLFKARHAEAYLDEDNPFYNYEFYVIPDESGDIGLNSVVIAERYYEDKYTEEKFATGNATYFFKYKDLMVLSNMKKSEMTKERKNIVFTVNHFIATDKKDGTWAIKMIYNLAKTMLSNDLNEYSKENQAKIVLEKLATIYSHDEIMKLIDKADDIDSGKYLYYVEEKFIQDITHKNNIAEGKHVDNETENNVTGNNETSVGNGTSVGDDETSVGDEQR